MSFTKTGRERGEISPALRERLPKYYRTLVKLYGDGTERISSEELASYMSYSTSQVKSDMLSIGCSGHRGYGYQIKNLYKRVSEILQLADKYSAVIVGCSSIGRAISETPMFTKRGVKLLEVFRYGNQPDGVGRDIADFENYCRENKPDILILSCGDCSVDTLLRTAAELSFIEVWNFSDMDIMRDDIKVVNFHLNDHIMMLCSQVEGKAKSEKS